MMKQKILRILIQFIFILFSAEIIMRMIYYQKIGMEPFALTQALKRIKQKFAAPRPVDYFDNHFLARPDSGKVVNKQIAREAIESNQFEYSPWIEYKPVDYSGKYISSKGLVRTSTPKEFINPESPETTSIYFFGGSTMYGVNVTDKETIAAAFVKSYASLYPAGHSISVQNYGIPAYYSYNELMLLSHLIYTGHKPSMAIFLDGLNDLLIIKAAKRRWPWFYYKLMISSKNTLSMKDFSKIDDSTYAMFKLRNNESPKETADTLIENYLSNIENIRKIADLNHIRAYFFIQPNPYFNYPNQSKDPICDHDNNEVVRSGYRLLENQMNNSENSFFLGNMLQNEKGFPFIDRFHYSPDMCNKIAKRMAEVIGRKINE